MAEHVFISHAEEDRPIALRVCATLEREGHRCWIAPRNIRASEEYGAAIVRGIEGSAVVLVLISAHANVSRWVLREVQSAEDHDKPIVPVRIAGAHATGGLAFRIATLQWIDIESLDNLLPLLEALREGPLGSVGGTTAVVDTETRVQAIEPASTSPLNPGQPRSEPVNRVVVSTLASGQYAFIVTAYAVELILTLPLLLIAWIGVFKYPLTIGPILGVLIVTTASILLGRGAFLMFSSRCIPSPIWIGGATCCMCGLIIGIDIIAYIKRVKGGFVNEITVPYMISLVILTLVTLYYRRSVDSKELVA